jgi:hypothetical protein
MSLERPCQGVLLRVELGKFEIKIEIFCDKKFNDILKSNHHPFLSLKPVL